MMAAGHQLRFSPIDAPEPTGGFLAAAIEASIDGLAVFRLLRDRHGTVTDLVPEFLNVRVSELLGRPHAEIVGRPLSELLGQELRLITADAAAATERGEPIERELRTASPALAGRWVRYRLAPFAEGVVVNVEDITARKQAEEQLRVNQARFLAAAESSLQAFALLVPTDAPDGRSRRWRFTYVNRIADHFLQRGGGTALGRYLDEVLAGAHRPFQRRCEEVMETGEPIIQEFDLNVAGLQRRWLRVQLYPVGDEVAVTAEDISERIVESARLAASEGLHRSIVDTMQEGLYIMDRSNTITFANKRYAEWTGLTPEQLVGRRALDFVAPADRAFVEWKADMRRVGVEPRTNRAVDILSVDGTRRTVLGMGVRLPDELGDGAVLITVTDVSEQAAARRALETSESRYRAIVDATHEGIMVVDGDGIILYANRRIATLLRTTVEALTGTHALAIVHPEDRARAAARSDAVRTGIDDDAEGDLRLARADGSEIWAAGQGARLSSPPGALLIAVRDVTERRRNEEAVKATAARYQTIVETASEGILRTAKDGTVIFANRRAIELFGRPAEELIGMQLLMLVHPEDRRASLRRIQRYLDGTLTADQTEVRLVRGDGSPLSVLASTAALWAPDGAFDGAISMFVDLTERLAAEEARRELAAQVAAAEERERQRLADDLHDGPVQQLSALALRLGMMRRRRDESLDARLAEGEAQVRETVSSLRSLMFQLLPPDLEHDGLATALERMAHSILGDGEVTVTVRSDVEESAGAGPVARALYRIGREALVNVRKHARAHHADVALRSRDGGLLLIVTDDGVGLPATAHDTVPGHLGLRAITDRARSVGGWATIERTEPTGTRVTAWAPIG